MMLIRHGSLSAIIMLDPNTTTENETHFLTVKENVTKPWVWDYELDADFSPPNEIVNVMTVN